MGRLRLREGRIGLRWVWTPDSWRRPRDSQEGRLVVCRGGGVRGRESGTQRKTGMEILGETERVRAGEKKIQGETEMGGWAGGEAESWVDEERPSPGRRGTRAIILALSQSPPTCLLPLGSAAAVLTSILHAVAPALSPPSLARVVWFNFHKLGGGKSSRVWERWSCL